MHDYTEDNVIMVDIDDVIPYTDSSRPRGRINEDALRELAESIKKHGMLTPLVVSMKNGKYQIISGKRRFLAAKLAGTNKVPVHILEAGDEDFRE